MLNFFILFLLIVNHCYSLTLGITTEKSCGCYDACTKNFTNNSVKDLQKIEACQRGCRFYLLILHTSHEKNTVKNFTNAKYGCHLCNYNNPAEISPCNFGCAALETARTLCTSGDKPLAQVSYSLVIEESDVLIHPDPDDVLTDPGLRKQFEKTLEALLDAKQKLPEIHFRNLPIKNKEAITEYSHIHFKCPRFYGLDSKFEFRNGKVVVGDIYLFGGVFLFVLVCFLLGHYFESKAFVKSNPDNSTGDLNKSKIDRYDETEPFLKVDIDDQIDLLIEKHLQPGYYYRSKFNRQPYPPPPPPPPPPPHKSNFNDVNLGYHDNGKYKSPPPYENYPEM
ncbi:hypothetical protein Phum_PHUM336640 [Pediculus humanus corporis]|uniref:Uncharacterized protein n=1 Tax=Pediculus humanus subsp. corporis TaxID=121224 RepID=E0VNK4_PEDHC|nr:uncharacterized protein Phum_PHUM336640 [Pediculus humanus corporis]EEB14960.1 hypothetical protein Phum_PHUM336640 [Pediculus humanus corporis]